MDTGVDYFDSKEIGFEIEETATAVTKNFVYVLLLYQNELKEKIGVIVTVGHLR